LRRRAKIIEASTELVLGLVCIYFLVVGLLTGKVPYPSKYSYALPDAELALNPEGYWYSIIVFALGSAICLTMGIISMKKVVYRNPEET